MGCEEVERGIGSGERLVEETLLDNRINAKTRASVCLWGRVWEKVGRNGCMYISWRKMAENPVTCAARPPAASCTWWCSLSDGFLDRGRERKSERQLIIILLLPWYPSNTSQHLSHADASSL